MIAITTSSDVVRPSLNGTSLLGKIHNDPAALLKMFDTADGQEIQRIIDLLKELITEGEADIEAARSDIEAAELRKTAAKKVWDEAAGAEATAETVLTDARQELSNAEGVVTEAKRIHGLQTPALKKEIEVFEKVIGILEKLLDGSEKNLVNLNSTVVLSFISLSDQADPTKVQKVLDLLQALYDTSDKELTRLNDAVTKAENNLKTASDNELAAAGKLAQAEEATKDAEQDYDKAVGSYNIAKKQGEARIKVITEEIKTIENLIKLLSPLLN